MRKPERTPSLRLLTFAALLLLALAALVSTAAERAPVATAMPELSAPPAESPASFAADYSYTDGVGALDEYGTYADAGDVAYYIHVFGHLPDNYITKDEAEDAGWAPGLGNLWDVASGMSIGGDRFANRERLLPEGEIYYECDVNYSGGYRGDERIIYTDDGDVYYTADHYESFQKLY